MVSSEFSLDGKKALVAGDSRFWSKHITAALAEAGADVAVATSDSEKLKEATAEVQKLGKKAVAITADITQSSQVKEMVDQAIAGLGKIDILVNAADLEFAKPFVDITEDEWHRVMAANLNSVFLSCQAVGKPMLSQQKGRIINIISCLAERGMINGAAYCASMGGVLEITRALAIEWARQGITVNAIGAGWPSETETTGAPGEDKLLRYLPLKRYGHPSEVGSMVVYLASDAADYLSGQFMYVDGGIMAHL